VSNTSFEHKNNMADV